MCGISRYMTITNACCAYQDIPWLLWRRGELNRTVNRENQKAEGQLIAKAQLYIVGYDIGSLDPCNLLSGFVSTNYLVKKAPFRYTRRRLFYRRSICLMPA